MVQVDTSMDISFEVDTDEIAEQVARDLDLEGLADRLETVMLDNGELRDRLTAIGKACLGDTIREKDELIENLRAKVRDAEADLKHERDTAERRAARREDEV